MEHKPQQGDIIIVQRNNNSCPMKIKVLEVTETTYYLANMDEKQPIIQKLEEGANYIINSDNASQKTTEQIVQDFKNYQGQWLIQDETEYNVKFRTTIKAFNNRYTIIEVISTAESRAIAYRDSILKITKNKD